jgi:HTH-type transcriptional repressor of NAD biosynthesis genes
MTRAFVLMTAMPPTKGHMNLIRFAASLPVSGVKVIVCTQPHEPFYNERWLAVVDAVNNMHSRFTFTAPVEVERLHRNLEQDPSVEGFWPMWDAIMQEYGFKPGDFVVSSELYGQTLADRNHGVFMPYDPNRELYYTKATNIRNKLANYFHDILPEFQRHLVTRVTIFGAESTGKTTLSKELAWTINGHWLFEYARPYLEAVGKEITVEKMNAIWKGQLATQRHSDFMYDKPFIIQDTDLFSTVGYWMQPHWTESLGQVPSGLIDDALRTTSDLYIITRSNIPFEPDDIRYGIDRRESPDEFWIGIAEKFNLNYVVLDQQDVISRTSWAAKYAKEVAGEKAESIFYDRMGL